METNTSVHRNLPYKYCCVPLCCSTTVNTPDKLFLSVPQDAKRRKLWLKAAKRDDVSDKTRCVYFCEDHFQMEDCVDNLMYVRMTKGRMIIKKTAMPTNFECQGKKICSTEPTQSLAKKRKRLRVEKQQTVSAMLECNTRSTTIEPPLAAEDPPEMEGDGIIIKEEQEDFTFTCQANYWGPILPIDTASFTSSEIKAEEYLGSDGMVIKEEPDDAFNDWEVVQPSGENTLTVTENIKVETSAEDKTLGSGQLRCGTLLLNDFRTLSAKEQVSCNKPYNSAVEGAEKTSNSEKLNEVSSHALTDKTPFLFNGPYYKCANCSLWCNRLSDIATQIRGGNWKTRTVPEEVTRNSLQIAKKAERGNTKDTKANCEANLSSPSWKKVVTRNSLQIANVAEKGNTKDTKAKCEANFSSPSSVRNSLQSGQLTDGTSVPAENSPDTPIEIFPTSDLYGEKNARGKLEVISFLRPLSFSKSSQSNLLTKENPFPSGNLQASLPKACSRPKFPDRLSHLSNLSRHIELDCENSPSKGLQSSLLKKFHNKNLQSSLLKNSHSNHFQSSLLTTENPVPAGNLKTPLAYACSKCRENFLNLSDLCKHEEFRNCKSKYNLFLLSCDSQTTNLSENVLGLRQNLLKDFPASCGERFLCFSSLDTLTTHILEQHKSPKNIQTPFQEPLLTSCFKCNMYFCSLPALAKHISRWHENTKPPKNKQTVNIISCVMCNKYFTSLYILTMHMFSSHKKPLLIKPSIKIFHFLCSRCKMRFKLQSDLQKHMRCHRPLIRHKFTCEKCKMSFTLRFALNKHMKAHTANASRTEN